jgi:Protein of unknown function (DUF1203)
MTSAYEIRAIPAETTAALRDRDDAGRTPRVVTVHDGGSPLRCCLRMTHRNEPVLLVSYAPLRRWAREAAADPGPYDELGPVFIHAEECGGYLNEGLPAELFDSRRVFRAYAATGSILGGRLVEAGESAERALEEILANPEVALVHARALEFGCFTFEVRRVTADPRL